MQAAFAEYCRRTTRPVDPCASIAQTLAEHHLAALAAMLSREDEST
jgi:hypothetical protein